MEAGPVDEFVFLDVLVVASLEICFYFLNFLLD